VGKLLQQHLQRLLYRQLKHHLVKQLHRQLKHHLLQQQPKYCPDRSPLLPRKYRIQRQRHLQEHPLSALKDFSST
jgi:hypothetical protein